LISVANQGDFRNDTGGSKQEVRVSTTKIAGHVNAKDKKLGRNYDRAAWFYERSSKIYSTNQIRSSKRYQMQHLQPGEKILYLGAGAGEDALMAARHGAEVTCIDISQGMLDQVQKKLDAENLSAELICINAYDHQRFEHYDVVAANYFLNVFRRNEMAKMLNFTAGFVRPGGKYLIADVATAQGNLLAKAFRSHNRN